MAISGMWCHKLKTIEALYKKVLEANGCIARVQAEALPEIIGTYWNIVLPRGSKYPMFEASGPKYHTLDGIWDKRPSILGTWTLCIATTS